MSELNPSQRTIAETLEGMIVVDAGPGTGKTHTIVERFINLLRQENTGTKDVLLMTFTRNAANEMEERIRGKIAETELAASSKFLQTSTFDSFCFSVVMESPETVSRFFKMEEILTRKASITDNYSLNLEYFTDVFDRFMISNPDEYGLQGVVASQSVPELFKIINELMSRGIVPLKKGWFGGDDGKRLLGVPDEVFGRLITLNREFKPQGGNKLSAFLLEKMSDDRVFMETYNISGTEPLPEEMLKEAAFEDRNSALELIHDIYYEYIRNSINDDRLTYGLVATFAFIVLYTEKTVRERMSVKYLMIDEFQDTNENQLMIALMLLKEANLCVVGDWKQGIYGFRHVSIDNITNFKDRAKALRKWLNDDIVRVPYSIPEVKKLPLIINYRSSQIIIDTAFEALYVPGKEDEIIDKEKLNKDIIRITADRKDIGADTKVEFVSALSREDEVSEVIRTIAKYVTEVHYIHNGNEKRRADFGDIAVLCRKTALCREISAAASIAGIPAFLQGDIEVMCTREGKLLLAWLKYVNNEDDEKGIGPILADAGYSLEEILKMRRDPPQIFSTKRNMLRFKRRRITDLISSIFAFYNLNNDITQTIISVISSSHRESLLTISDVIRMLEKDIESQTKYEVDGMLDRKAVTIQTMHKSKGLEYPIVIIAGMDIGEMPLVHRDTDTYSFNDITGIRCKKDVSSFGGDYSKMTRSWKTYLAKHTVVHDYSEERRLMFVALSRAKQFVSVISGNEPSLFFQRLSHGQLRPCGNANLKEMRIKDAEAQLIPAPVKAEFSPRRINLGVHDIMRSDDTLFLDGEVDEVSGKGRRYGIEIHDLAHAMATGHDVDDERKEIPRIREILDKAKDADLIFQEIECTLPFNDLNVTLKGVIDLLVVRPEVVEVHDYKTDEDSTHEGEYKIQLSVYAHAASGVFGRPAICIIEYVSQGRKVEFEPLQMEIIAGRVRDYISIIKGNV